eukprot:CAMPEP_0115324042 /NCGR_PEP_ID=MMETSP0270-20121206/82266_1 /TAXON_ID=71861 /ORGANISM="Scrippsiella trochoidea, Strain CCMP3099" /LENGTH=64 /DNA_ID=CAMNT_0002744131 /DNA_START=65 /DNA_END=256 /DNA_ORIENTATION=-
MILQLGLRSDARARCAESGEDFDRFKTIDGGAVMGDRTFLNTLEQMGPFLAALWSCAVCVDPGL